jgi:hypothetical protein
MRRSWRMPTSSTCTAGFFLWARVNFMGRKSQVVGRGGVGQAVGGAVLRI